MPFQYNLQLIVEPGTDESQRGEVLKITLEFLGNRLLHPQKSIIP
jgi:hypothetical protein